MRVLLFLLVSALAVASARTVTWTGAANNGLWSFASNWDANAVPTAQDDVVLNPVGGSTVTVSQPSVAKSIVIGGTSFHQTLTLLSSLAVGTGGISIKSQGYLQLSGNNDLPLTSVGDIVASSGGTIVFNSGDVKGPGQVLIDYGAYLEFSGSALKLFEAVDVTVHGTATIQPTTIQLSKGATFTNGGDVTAVGSINIFSNDNSDASFYSYGNFSYNGGAVNAPLTFQLATYFAADLDVVSGAVLIEGYFHSAADINLPAGTTLTIQSGTEAKSFKSITGSGSVNVAGTAEIDGVLSVSWVTVSDSGRLTLNMTSSTKSLSVMGQLTLSKGCEFSAQDASFSAGTLSGDGQLSVRGNFEIAVSSSGNANNFLSAKVNVITNGYFTGSVVLLFSAYGNLNVMKGASFLISSSSSLIKQSGEPVVTNNGDFNVRLPVGGTLHSNVDFAGTGTFTVTTGEVTFDTSRFYTNALNLGNLAVARFMNTVVNTSSVNGAGSLNISASPDATAMFGDVSLNYLGVVQGTVRTHTLKLTTLEVFNGELKLDRDSINTATLFNFYGGTVSGASKLTLSTFNVGGDIPQNVNATIINTNRFTLRAGTPQGTLMTFNNAQINAGVTGRMTIH